MKKNTTSKNSTRRKTEKKIKQKFPRGWNERKVRAVIQHYDRLTDDELAHEIETAREVRDETLISIPTQLLPAVQKLIVQHQQSA
jgi:O-phosphoseryl-tRNA(Cys) synthetase